MTYTPPYSDDFKAQIVARILAGESPTAVHRETGVTHSAIKDWVARHQRASGLTELLRHHTTPHPVVKSPEITAHAPSTVLVIPDMHHPFCHSDALDFLKAVRAKYNPTLYVCLGDELDAHAFSRYPMDPDGMTAGQELQAAIASLQPFYLEFPHMLICESNHTVRPWKKAYDSGLPASFLPAVAKIMNAPDGWVWKRKHEIDGVMYIHGDNGRSGQYAAVNYMKQAKQPVVIGHIHAYASVFYEGKHFAMNTGCLIDKEAYAFKYARGAILDVSLGCGIVQDGKQAYFIPMLLDDNQRWIGHL